MMDAVNLHVLALREEGDRRIGYIAIRLEDGRSPDGVLYDSRRDAARHHKNNPATTYVKIGRDTMSLREAKIVLKLHRNAYDRGVVFSEEEIVTPNLTEVLRRADVIQGRTRLRGQAE